MDRLDRVLSRIESSIILLSYSTLIALVGIETLRRMLTGNQAIWGPEVALFAFIWMSWFAMAEHVRNGTNLSFGMFRQRLGKKLQLALESFDLLLWMVIGFIIIYFSIGAVSNNIAYGQTIFGTSIPIAVATVAVPAGWAFTMIRAAQRLFFLLASCAQPASNGVPRTIVNL